jgi:hypothetical protein
MSCYTYDKTPKNNIIKMNPQLYITSGSGHCQPKENSLVIRYSGMSNPVNRRSLMFCKTAVFSHSGSGIVCIVLHPEDVGTTMLPKYRKTLRAFHHVTSQKN